MGRLGPFEPRPHLAVAVSGGGDSMALMLLAVDWAGANDGRVTALTVDHGLRTESATEAATVADWCRRIGCCHETLVWQHDAPVTSALQEQARAARYRLLQQAAARHGILHLLVAHHADDQAETIAMRRNHGSGPDGLAGMAAIQPLDSVCILRPLLGVPGERLKQTCRQRGQPWIEDPSNRSASFERVRVRQARRISDLPPDADASLRVEHEIIRAAFLARTLTIFPTGHAAIDTSIWAAAPSDVAAAALGDILRCIGNLEHAPNRDSLARLASGLTQPDFAGVTLGGCHITRNAAGVMVMPEHRNTYPGPVTLEPGLPARWGAFHVEATKACTVAAIDRHWPETLPKPLPFAIVRGQPGFYVDGALVAAPTVDYVRPGIPCGAYFARFAPQRGVATGIFPIVS